MKDKISSILKILGLAVLYYGEKGSQYIYNGKISIVPKIIDSHKIFTLKSVVQDFLCWLQLKIDCMVLSTAFSISYF